MLYPPRGLSHYRDDLRLLTSPYLREQREFYRWELAELETAAAVAYREQSTAFVRFKLDEIDRELARRESRRASPAAPGVGSPPPDRRRQWEEIKETLALPDLIEELVPQTAWIRSGPLLKCRCPFGLHLDTNPSFVLYPSQESFHCFGCGIGGTVFDFVMAYHPGLTFGDALVYLRELTGLARTDPEPELRGQRPAFQADHVRYS